MNLIEKAARASHEFFRHIYKLPPWEEIPKDAQSMALQHARAILTDIREPSDAMTQAGFEKTGDPCWQENVKQAWSAMIDAGMAES